jgi:CheY-like chemotaxis protein
MRKILVVEDDPNTMNLIAILLEREGYAVVKATSAE